MLTRLDPPNGSTDVVASTRVLEGKVESVQGSVATVCLFDEHDRQITAKCQLSELEQAGITQRGLFQCVVSRTKTRATAELIPLPKQSVDLRKSEHAHYQNKYRNMPHPNNDSDSDLINPAGPVED